MSIEPVSKEPAHTSSGKDEGVRQPRKKRKTHPRGIEPRQFVRKAFYVTGVQVTEDNMSEVAEWCGGSIQENGEGQKYIKVHATKAIYDRQTQARPGDWVLKAGKSWKVYTQKSFNDVFEEVREGAQTTVEEDKPESKVEGDPMSALSPEAREALLLIANQIKSAATPEDSSGRV